MSAGEAGLAEVCWWLTEGEPSSWREGALGNMLEEGVGM